MADKHLTQAEYADWNRYQRDNQQRADMRAFQSQEDIRIYAGVTPVPRIIPSDGRG